MLRLKKWILRCNPFSECSRWKGRRESIRSETETVMNKIEYKCRYSYTAIY